MATTDGTAGARIPGAPQALALGLLLTGASLSLARLFQGKGWLLPVVLVIAAALGLAALLRRLRVPTIPALLLMVPGFFLVAAILLFPETLIVVIPTRATFWAMVHAVPVGFNGMNNEAAPVILTREFLLLLCAFVWLVATVSDAITFRAHRPLLALLPAMTLLIYPAAIRPIHPGWYSLWFFLGAAPVLATEGRARLAGWGRWVSAPQSRPQTEWRLPMTPAAAAGRWMLAVAGAVALVVPWLLPGYGQAALIDFKQGLGVDSSYSIDPLVSLAADLHARGDAVLFTVQSTDATYWRLLTLDHFDGTTWSSSADPSTAKRFTGATTGDLVNGAVTETIQETIKIDNLTAEPWLPLAAAPSTVNVPGYQVLQQPTSLGISIGRRLPGNLIYTATSLQLDPSATQLEAATESNDTALSSYLAVGGISPRVKALADHIVDAAHATTFFDKAVALQDYLRGPTFHYTLNPKGLTGGSNQLVDFLFNVKAGYCQQFAASMAAMARVLGIPARVAVGFTTGTRVGTSDTYVVRTSDAHAWPELYFSKIGWVRFEPTPRLDSTVLQPFYTTTAGRASTQPLGSQGPAPKTHGARVGHVLHPNAPKIKQTTPIKAPGAQGFSVPLQRLIAVLVVVALILLIAPVAKAGRWVVRRRRAAAAPRAQVMLAYSQLGDWATDAGIGRRVAETPSAYALRMRTTLANGRGDDGLGSLDDLTRLYLRAEYGPREPSEQDAASARQLAQASRRALGRRIGWERRLIALVSPRSLTAGLRERRDRLAPVTR